MRIVLQGVETCGVIYDLASELKRQGHEVVAIADHSPLFDREYDYGLTDFLEDSLTKGKNFKTLRCCGVKALKRLATPVYRSVSTTLRDRVCLNSDLYVQIWSGWCGEYKLLEKLHRNGVKIATLFMGSEVRHYPTFQGQYGESDWEFPANYASTLEEKVKRLKAHEKYSDAIFSVPDQMGLASRPYHHLVVPVHWEDIEFNIPDRDRPLVVHAPTSEWVKGTRVIEGALQQLCKEGVEFDYLPVKRIPREALLKILSVADVLVDELLLHGPGWLGFEAMSAGCAVATRYLENSPAIFRPPVWSVDRRNVKDRLATLLTDKHLRRRLAIEGRHYVEQNNGLEIVVKHILTRVEQGDRSADYVPHSG